MDADRTLAPRLQWYTSGVGLAPARTLRDPGRTMMKKLMKRMLLCVVLVGAVSLWWSTLSDSKKRFYIHLGKQVPEMPFRYFA